jgi:hypothetical protein
MKDKPSAPRAARASAHAVPKEGGLRMVGGRLVGPTLADPEVKRGLSDFKADLRSDPEKLREWYVKQGVLTKGGKLTKTYGG